jgi:hypothetical protein
MRNSLVEGIVQEDKCNDGVGRSRVTVLCEECRTDCLKSEEHEHAGRGDDEERATTDTLNQERSTEGPEHIPHLEDSIDQELKTKCFV